MKLRQFFCIAAVFGIFALSVYFTCTVCSMFWRSFENRDKVIDLDVSTYQVKYDNVWDKMKIYSKSVNENKFEKLNIKLTDENKRELVKSVSSQIDMINMYLNNIIPDISVGKIKSCKQYVVYGDSDANGFACWYLAYEGGDKEVRVIVDTEFMTVYRISMYETKAHDTVVIYKTEDNMQEAGKPDKQIIVERVLDWNNCDIHSNLFLEFYKITMNRMPDFDVVADSKGIVINAVYHDDFDSAEVEVPFLVRNIISEDRQMFDWGMSYFDELIQQ